MKRRSKLHELPEIIKTSIKGFVGMTAVVSVLSLMTVILYFKERR